MHIKLVICGLRSEYEWFKNLWPREGRPGHSRSRKQKFGDEPGRNQSIFMKTQCFIASFTFCRVACRVYNAESWSTNSSEQKLSVFKMKIYIRTFSFECGYICLFWHGNPFLRWSLKPVPNVGDVLDSFGSNTSDSLRQQAHESQPEMENVCIGMW